MKNKCIKFFKSCYGIPTKLETSQHGVSCECGHKKQIGYQADCYCPLTYEDIMNMQNSDQQQHQQQQSVHDVCFE